MMSRFIGGSLLSQACEKGVAVVRFAPFGLVSSLPVVCAVRRVLAVFGSREARVGNACFGVLVDEHICRTCRKQPRFFFFLTIKIN